MPLNLFFRLQRLAALSAVALACTACAGVSNWSLPYKTEVIQGNFVSKEQVALLQPGMPRAQVRELLGTPLITSAFHADRWDYSFTLRRQGVAPQARKLVLFFNGDVLQKFEGDPMPSESEFVTQVDTRRRVGKVPELQATEAQLQAAQSKGPAPDATPNTAAPASADGPPKIYPPLESAPR